MTILVKLCCVLSIVIAESWALDCQVHQTPVVQMCQSGTVSGNQVHIDTRDVPDNMADREECTCDVDLGGGTVKHIDYNGPDGWGDCGYKFRYGNSLASCLSHTSYSEDEFTSVTLTITITGSKPYACFSVTMDDNANASITCQEYSKSTTPSTTTTTTTEAATTSSTSTTETSLAGTTPTLSISTMSPTSSTTSRVSSSTQTSTGRHPGSSSTSTASSTASVSVEDPTTTDTPDKKGLTQTTVIGIAAGGGGAVLIIIVVTVICCCRCRKESKKSPPHYENTEADMYMTENALYGRNIQAAPIVASNDVTAPEVIDHYTMVDIDEPGRKDKNRASQSTTQTAVYDQDMAIDDAGLSVSSSNEAITGNTGHMVVGEGGALYAVVSKRQPADTAKGDNSAHGEPNNTEATYAVVSKKKKTAPSEGNVEASPEALPSPSAADAEKPTFTRIVGTGDYAIVE